MADCGGAVATEDTIKTRVLLADEHPLALHSLQNTLQKAPDVEVVGHCHSVPGALELMRQLAPDVCIVDTIVLYWD
mgnify:CR=1 FL=1